MPKKSSSFYLPETSKRSSNSSNRDNKSADNGNNKNSYDKFEHAGWLYKWTNYVKGYRQRWFVIDSTGNLRYFRSQNDVNGPSRGFVYLAEANIHTNQNDGHTLIITAPASHTLHLKATNEVERSKWLRALECAKHRAIRMVSSMEDEEDASEIFLSKTRYLKDLSLAELNVIVNDLKAISTKFDNEFEGFLHYAIGHLNVNEAKKCDVKARNLKQLREEHSKLMEELVAKYKKEYEMLGRLANSQNEKIKELQKQYEILARQHSQLEGEAFRLSSSKRVEENNRSGDDVQTNDEGKRGTTTTTDDAEIDAAAAESEDQFLDATDTLPSELLDREHRLSLSFSSNGGIPVENGGGSEKSLSFCCEDGEDVEDEENSIEVCRGNSDSSIRSHSHSSSSAATANNNAHRSAPLDFSKCRAHVPDQMSDYKENVQPTTPATAGPPPHRRHAIQPKPESHGLNLWAIMRNCIGKELTRIPLPVNFNEPLSMLQRITEDLEYSYLLDRAAEKTDICERLAYVAAFAVSCYSATAKRTTKPFNPLLGETFEFDRREDLGWRSLAEQVSHHPPAAAMHTEGVNWKLHQEFMVASRFRGKYMSVVPTGYTHVKFNDGRTMCTFQKVTTTVHNIIVGKLWIDNHGEMTIFNHSGGERAILKFHSYSYFSSNRPRKVEGVVLNGKGYPQLYIEGYWDSHINIASVENTLRQNSGKASIRTGRLRRIWTVNQPIGDSSSYNFTKLAIEMNELDGRVAPTDSRRRPDQRLMEDGDWDAANKRKNELEDKQRKVRRIAEEEAETAINNNQQPREYEARWFKKQQDNHTGSVIHVIKNEDYWECKDRQDWSRCADIF